MRSLCFVVGLLLCVELTSSTSISVHDKLFGSTHNVNAGLTELDIHYNDNTYTSYTVTVNGQSWLNSGFTGFRNDGDWDTLILNKTQQRNGNDALGSYSEFVVTWNSQNQATQQYSTTLRQYPNNPDIIVFTQTYVSGVTNATMSNADAVISSFPSFLLNNDRLGYAHWAGRQIMSPEYGLFGPSNVGNLTGGRSGTGPFAIFDDNMTDCIVISALTDHMAASSYPTTTGVIHKYYEYQFGLIGNVSIVEPGFSISFIMSSTKNGGGVNAAMRNWGDIQLKYYGKERGNAHNRDVTLNYLGYSTDNGAYYYYETEFERNYQQTMIDVKKYHLEIGLPTKYVLLDSWWYYKGSDGGMMNWTARPDIFPDGMVAVYEATGWLVQAHNRFFSIENVYANNIPNQNETGDFEFTYGAAEGKTSSLPMQEEFWKYFFDINMDWGLRVYEQDFLSQVMDQIELLSNSTTFGHEWLKQMASQAEEHGLCVQYCMDYPRHVMTSVGFNSVTQCRATHDYKPGNDQWKIGVAALFTSSIDIAPSKDSYWSEDRPQGGHYPIGTREPHNRLQSAVLSLTNGPVAISDRIRFTDISLVMRCCSTSGLLLRPDTSATMIDSFFRYASGLNTDISQLSSGRVWSTTSKIGNNELFRYLYVFAVLLDTGFDLYPKDIDYHFEDNVNDKWLVYETNTTDKYEEFASNNPLNVKQCPTEFDFQLFTLIPISNITGWYLAGEIDKWITVSNQRFKQIDMNDDGETTVRVSGEVGESVNIAFVNSVSLQQKVITCEIGETEQITIKMPQETCQDYYENNK